jgi:hypothetical protein
MKAILHSFASLFGLLAVAAIGHGYYGPGYTWVTPVYRCPYPQAPSPSNSGFYLPDAYGRPIPHYYLVPPGRPFNGYLPGPTGAAIMSGNLPHTLLLSKEGLTIGNVPMLQTGRHKDKHAHPDYAARLPGLDQMQPNQPMAPLGGMPPFGTMQVPYGPWSQTQATPHPMRPMPYSMQPMPNPLPHGAMPMPNPMQPTPYGAMPYPTPAYPTAAPGQTAAWHNPTPGVWPANNAHRHAHPHMQPFMPIPNHHPHLPAPNAPMLPPLGPMQPFVPATPLPPGMPNFQPFGQMQPPMPPVPNFAPLQMPRMDMVGPPAPPHVGGGAYPNHPFTRSPRDFFMWGENMEDEAKMRNRPFPVPR